MSPTRARTPVVDSLEAVGALAVMLGWNGGVMPLWIDDGKARPRRKYHGCPDGLAAWLWAAVQLYDRRLSCDVSIGLPELKEDAVSPRWSTVLWAWVQGKDQATRAARFRPMPSMVLRVDGSSRRLLLWWLDEPVNTIQLEAANRKIAYALHAKQRDGLPNELRIPLPGSFIRVGRSRPAAVLVTRLEGDIYTLGRVVGGLKSPPDPDAWRERR